MATNKTLKIKAVKPGDKAGKITFTPPGKTYKAPVKPGTARYTARPSTGTGKNKKLA